MTAAALEVAFKVCPGCDCPALSDFQSTKEYECLDCHARFPWSDAKPVYRGEFRPTAAELKAICDRGADLLMAATPDDMKTFRKWT